MLRRAACTICFTTATWVPDHQVTVAGVGVVPVCAPFARILCTVCGGLVDRHLAGACGAKVPGQGGCVQLCPYVARWGSLGILITDNNECGQHKNVLYYWGGEHAPF
ncbi:unnamed protein product [Ostreobium quekettii]|uniref:Uncharacterized protein n=1 Tax=Ostreobium quekettii TaxID=121088 RepID=A0A8S1ITW3_9CHLO|nr:unnamed protein product [Ostreobium quekettii]